MLRPLVDMLHTGNYISSRGYTSGKDVSHEIYLGAYRGEVRVPPNSNNEFLEVLSNDVVGGCVPCIEERPTPNYKMHLDFDYDVVLDPDSDSDLIHKNNRTKKELHMYTLHAQIARSAVCACYPPGTDCRAIVTMSSAKIETKWKAGDVVSEDGDIVSVMTEDGDVVRVPRERVRIVARQKKQGIASSASVSSFDKVCETELTRLVPEPGLRVQFSSNVKKVGIHVIFPGLVVNSEIGRHLIHEVRIREEAVCGPRLHPMNAWSDVIRDDSHVGKTALRMCYSDRAEECRECSDRSRECGASVDDEIMEAEEVAAERSKSLLKKKGPSSVSATARSITMCGKKRVKPGGRQHTLCGRLDICNERFRMEGRPHLPLWLLVGTEREDGYIPFTGGVLKALQYTSIRTEAPLTDGYAPSSGFGKSVVPRSSTVGLLKPIDQKMTVFRELLYTFHQQIYRRAIVTSAKQVKENNYIVDIVGPGSTYCHSIRATHPDANVYFVITEQGIVQRCHSKTCLKYSSKPEMLTSDQHAILYPTPVI